MSAEAVPDRLDLRRLLIVVSVMLAVLLEIIDTSIVNVALPSIMGNLGASLDEASWILTGYIVANVIVIPMTGWLASRFGRRRYFTTSIAVFTLASLFCGLSTSIASLVAWRIVQGLGGGALLATAQTILVESFPPARQGTAQAIFGVGAMVGPSLGPTLGGWLTDAWSWHWIFLVNVPLGIAAGALCATQLRDPPHARARRGVPVDWPGIALLVVGIGALQTLLERGHRLDWFASGEIRLLAVAAGVGLVGLVVRELRVEHPVVDFRVLRHRDLAVGCVLGALIGLGLYGSVFLFPLYTQSLLGWNAWDSGLAILPSSLTTAVMMAFVGRLVWRVGPRLLFLSGMGVMLVALWEMSGWTLACGFDQILGPQVLRGVAMGLLFVPLSTATLRSLPTPRVAAGAGLYNLFRQLGGSLGIAMLTTLLERRAAVHGTELASQLTPYRASAGLALAELSERARAAGLDPEAAERLAVAALGRLAGLEARVEAFSDAYAAIFVLFALMLPVAWRMRRDAPGRFRPVD